jgi:hypothetical protein
MEEHAGRSWAGLEDEGVGNTAIWKVAILSRRIKRVSESHQEVVTKLSSYSDKRCGPCSWFGHRYHGTVAPSLAIALSPHRAASAIQPPCSCSIVNTMRCSASLSSMTLPLASLKTSTEHAIPPTHQRTPKSPSPPSSTLLMAT